MSDEFSDWDELIKAISSCVKCPLHRYRKNPVPGEGPRNAKVMLIGEAPGATEDELGRPFVGAAGKLLSSILEEVGLPRSSVYITNVVKCRPPNNREPTDEEIEVCKGYLIAQIKLLKPGLIVLLGNVAGRTVFSLVGKQWSGITKMRGKIVEAKIAGITVRILPTIHPAAALYNPSMRSVLEEDLRRASEIAGSIRAGALERRSLLDYVVKKDS